MKTFRSIISVALSCVLFVLVPFSALAADGPYATQVSATSSEYDIDPVLLPEGDDGDVEYPVGRFDYISGTKVWPCFSDVVKGCWFEEPVHFVYEMDYFSGVGDGRFDPQGPMTRAMFVQVLANMSSNYAPEEYTESSFEDVDEGSWYFKAVEWAKDMGLVTGVSESSFAPMSPITREQAARILLTYFLKVDALEASESGYILSEWFDEFYGGNYAFKPDYDVFDTFADKESVSRWAIESMRWATSFSLLQGTKNNGVVTLRPQSKLTRAQAAAIIERVMWFLIEGDRALDKNRSLQNN